MAETTQARRVGHNSLVLVLLSGVLAAVIRGLILLGALILLAALILLGVLVLSADPELVFYGVFRALLGFLYLLRMVFRILLSLILEFVELAHDGLRSPVWLLIARVASGLIRCRPLTRDSPVHT